MENKKLFNKNFTIIVIGQLISLLGNSIQRFAFSLYILELTGSASLFSTIISIEIIPTILLSPFGGAAADRIDKKKIMVGLDFFCFIIIGLFTFLIYGTSYQILFIAVLMFILSIVNSIYQPAVLASIPAVIAKENLNTGNSIVTQISSITNLAGPIAAGFLYGIFGLKFIMIINVVSFFVSAIMELFLNIPFKVQKIKGSVAKVYINDIKESIIYIHNENPSVFYAILVCAGFNLFISPLYTVGVPFVEKIILGVSDEMYGFSEGFLAVGMIAGAAMASFMSKYISFEKIYIYFFTIAFSIIGMGVCTLSFVMGNENPHIVSYVILNISGFALMMLISLINIEFMTYTQLNVPGDMLGKTIGFITALSTAFIPIGQVIFGQLYDKLGTNIFSIYILSTIITLISALFMRKVVHYTINKEIEAVE